MPPEQDQASVALGTVLAPRREPKQRGSQTPRLAGGWPRLPETSRSESTILRETWRTIGGSEKAEDTAVDADGASHPRISGTSWAWGPLRHATDLPVSRHPKAAGARIALCARHSHLERVVMMMMVVMVMVMVIVDKPIMGGLISARTCVLPAHVVRTQQRCGIYYGCQ